MAALTLPVDLAPSLRARVEQLVGECGLATHPAPRRSTRVRESCFVCHHGGPMGAHHLADGTLVRVHKSCHRKLHRASRRCAERTTEGSLL